MDGEFHKEWKEALVTPILKKGNSEQIRDISCLLTPSDNYGSAYYNKNC